MTIYKKVEAPVEFLLVPHNAQSETIADEYEEPRLIARRILELTQASAEHETTSRQKERRNFREIAILLRTRTRLKEYEEALRACQIPFIVAGGIGFYQQQEIYDLTNLLRVLVDVRQIFPWQVFCGHPYSFFRRPGVVYSNRCSFSIRRSGFR